MPHPVPKNDQIFLHNLYNENDEVYRIDWSPVPESPHGTDVEYLLADNVRNRVGKLMTMAWNLKNIHLTLLPQHKSSNWIFELEAAMRFVDELFPPEEEKEWRK
jgi:hypothetical protein